MSEEKPGFIGQVFGVLYKPRKVFSTVDEGDLAKGLIVMILMVILASYSTMLYMGKIPLTVLSPQLEEFDNIQFEGTMGIFAGMGTGISIIVGWVLGTLLMHGLGRFSSGSGSAKRFFAMHGFASILGFFNQLIRIADASIIDQASLTSYFIMYRDIKGKALRALLGINLVNIWGLATVVLLVLAVEENYKIGRSRAIMIVLLPSVVHFLFTYFTS
jgi:hypothetical protein